jgi:hypothetical protein
VPTLPPDVSARYKKLAARGEKLKMSVRSSSTWILVSDQALYLGEPLERHPRSAITGIEIDRAGVGAGTLLFMAEAEPLARIDFQGSDRRLLLEVEKALAPRKKQVRILIEQDDYAPGETVRGHVEVEWPKAAPVRGIRISLIGTEDTTISISRGSGDDRSMTTYREQDTQVAEEWILLGGDGIGWFRSAKEALTTIFGTQTYPLLKAGRHRFPFKIKIPPDALPSYSGQHASVTYRIAAVVDVPLGFDRLYEGVLAVVEPRAAAVVPRTYEDDRPARGFFKKISADLRMGFEIRKVPYHYGERIRVRLRVENRSQKRIRRVRFSFFWMEYARAEGYDREQRKDVENFNIKFPDPSAEAHDYNLDIAVPAWPVPYQGRYSRVELWLSATLDIALAFDATLTVPIEIES